MSHLKRSWSQLTAVLVLGFPLIASAANAINVRGIPVDAPFIAHTRCYMPFVCIKKGEETASYDDSVWGRPQFQVGEVVLASGGRLTGKVALFQKDNDWEFIRHAALIIPEGEADAYYIGAGDAVIIRQQNKDKTDVYDGFGDAYLKRLISGTLRLSYNPAAGTSHKALSFVSPVVLDDLQQKMAAETLLKQLKSGKTVRDSMAVANTKQLVFDVISGIEVTDKEYLIYNETSKQTTAITASNYSDNIKPFFANCAAADVEQGKSLSKSMKKIMDAINYLNKTCF